MKIVTFSKITILKFIRLSVFHNEVVMTLYFACGLILHNLRHNRPHEEDLEQREDCIDCIILLINVSLCQKKVCKLKFLKLG